MVYIYLFLQRSDPGVKATWPNTGEEEYMVTLWLYLLNCLSEGSWSGLYKENPYNAQTMPRHFSYHNIDRGLGASQAF